MFRYTGLTLGVENVGLLAILYGQGLHALALSCIELL